MRENSNLPVPVLVEPIQAHDALCEGVSRVKIGEARESTSDDQRPILGNSRGGQFIPLTQAWRSFTP